MQQNYIKKILILTLRTEHSAMYLNERKILLNVDIKIYIYTHRYIKNLK